MRKIGFKLVKAEDVEHWKFIEKEYDKKCEESRKKQAKLDDERKLRNMLRDKLRGTEAVIFDIREDKLQNDSYICVQDNREVYWDDERKGYFFYGDLNIFVMSSLIFPDGKNPKKVNDVPYLQASFAGERVTIHELHCDFNEGLYENKGYATMMIEALIKIVQKSNCTSIGGMLSGVDALTDEKKEKRNGFYASRGFSITYMDELEKNGTIYMEIK